MEALRAMGYDLSTALADIVDNSLAAGARNVAVDYCSDPGDSWIAISDDGHGMSDAELREAMRFGDVEGPGRQRRVGDLGRFGLGLKTASLSQCRRVTVLSRTSAGEESCRTWDLDLVRRSGGWNVLTSMDAEVDRVASSTGFTGPGTMVLWRRPDRAGEGRVLSRRVGRARPWLAAWFHRFLADGRLRIRVGGTTLQPWDPYLLRHTATQDLGTEILGHADDPVRVTPFVLPHPSRLDEAALRDGGGPLGWQTHQGFYVYRGDSLVSTGGWLGIPNTPNTPHTRLARIAVEIAPSADEHWQVDVRKSRARPPAALEQRLSELAEHARRRSEQVFRSRGTGLERKGGRRDVTFVWRQVGHRGRVEYQVNRDHPVIAAALQAAAGRSVEAVLRLVEATVPVGLIAIEAGDDVTRTRQAPLEGSAESDARSTLQSMLAALPDDPVLRAAAVHALADAEPFNRFPDLLDELADQKPDSGV